jgi:cytochrome c oxidase subunit 2
MRNAKHYAAVIILIAIATVGLYFLFDAMFQLPTAASTEAGPIDNMFNVHFWIIAFLFALIMVIMLYSALVFRRQPGDEEDAPHVHGSTVLEIAWTILPTLAVISFAVWASSVFLDLVHAEDTNYVVSVTARQWSWSFQYPEEDNIRSSKLVLPVGRRVVLEMEAEDVIHSFWVPEFRVKQDLVPGQTTYLRFTPTVVGEYKLRCAEICGTGHALMLADVEVVAGDSFVTWVEDIKSTPDVPTIEDPAERGALWANNVNFNCVGCHSADGSPLSGPTWLGLYGKEETLADGSTVIADEECLRHSILNPNAQIVAGFLPAMPETLADEIAARQAEIGRDDIDIIDDIIAYIKTLEE